VKGHAGGISEAHGAVAAEQETERPDRRSSADR
jgi:hypothetical protein